MITAEGTEGRETWTRWFCKKNEKANIKNENVLKSIGCPYDLPYEELVTL